jgi:hypothetical protein
MLAAHVLELGQFLSIAYPFCRTNDVRRKGSRERKVVKSNKRKESSERIASASSHKCDARDGKSRIKRLVICDGI